MEGPQMGLGVLNGIRGHQPQSVSQFNLWAPIQFPGGSESAAKLLYFTLLYFTLFALLKFS